MHYLCIFLFRSSSGFTTSNVLAMEKLHLKLTSQYFISTNKSLEDGACTSTYDICDGTNAVCKPLCASLILPYISAFITNNVLEIRRVSLKGDFTVVH